MAPRTGDGSSQEPVDKKIPVAELAFREPTRIPGVNTMMLTTLVAGERRVVDGKDWLPPPMWFDPVRREICIERHRYPIERVHYYVQAHAAITKTPPPLDLEKYTHRVRVRDR